MNGRCLKQANQIECRGLARDIDKESKKVSGWKVVLERVNREPKLFLKPLNCSYATRVNGNIL